MPMPRFMIMIKPSLLPLSRALMIPLLVKKSIKWIQIQDTEREREIIIAHN